VVEKGFVFDCLKQPVTHERVDPHQHRILLPCPLTGAFCSACAGGGVNLVLDVLRVEFCFQFFYGLHEITVSLYPSVLRRVVWWYVCSAGRMR